MNTLELDGPRTWETLKQGNFIVNKSNVPSTALFTDQALEQKVMELKGVGSLVGITQVEALLD